MKFVRPLAFYSLVSMAAFTVAGAMGACLFSTLDTLTDELMKIPTTSTGLFAVFEVAWSGFVTFGSAGTVLITPMVLFVRLALGLMKLVLPVRITVALASIILWFKILLWVFLKEFGGLLN